MKFVFAALSLSCLFACKTRDFGSQVATSGAPSSAIQKNSDSDFVCVRPKGAETYFFRFNADDHTITKGDSKGNFPSTPDFKVTKYEVYGSDGDTYYSFTVKPLKNISIQEGDKMVLQWSTLGRWKTAIFNQAFTNCLDQTDAFNMGPSSPQSFSETLARFGKTVP